MEVLSAIETKFECSLPHGFKDWSVKGYTDYQNANYLWVHEAEWIPLEEVLDSNLRGELIIDGLIPFAFTGAGDNWCFNTRAKTDESEYEVLLCWHDEEKPDAYAPNFSAWFYRTCLDSIWLISDRNELDAAMENLPIWANRLMELDKVSWANHLLILKSKLPEDFEQPDSMLREDHKLRIIEEEIGKKYLTEKNEWGQYRPSEKELAERDARVAEAKKRQQRKRNIDVAMRLFKSKSYDRVIELLSPYAGSLSNIEAAKLKYARKKTGQPFKDGLNPRA